METAAFLLAPVALLAVLFVLVKGLYHFTQEGEAHRRRSNRMMRWRIGLQFVAVAVLFGLAMVFGS